MNSVDLRIFLEQHAIDAQIIQLSEPTLTVESVANALGVSPQQIVKSILFLVANKPVLAISNGMHPLDRRKIGNIFAAGRKQVRLATPLQVFEISGYEAGTLPPFAHQKPLPTFIDQRVLVENVVYAGGGDENALLRINPQIIHQITAAKVLDLIVGSVQTGS